MNALNHMKQQHLSFESLVQERTSAHECMNDVSNGSYEINGVNKRKPNVHCRINIVLCELIKYILVN